MNSFYSIIIPVYNVEKYLNRCVDSVLNQSFTDYEIILVDDGSTDSSGSICKEYLIDTRIKLVTKENGGLSSARNAGLLNASGQFVLFLDSDDYIADNSLNDLHNVIEDNKADIYSIKAKRRYDDGSEIDEHVDYPCGVFEKNAYMKMVETTFHYSACSPYMVYNAGFLKSNNISFREGILHEDELWMPTVISKARTICYSNIFLYYHCMRTGSITQSSNYAKRGESILIVLNELLKIDGFQTKNEYRVIRNQWAFLFLEAFTFLNDVRRFKKICSRWMPLRFSITSKMRLKSILYGFSPRIYYFVHKTIKR